MDLNPPDESDYVPSEDERALGADNAKLTFNPKASVTDLGIALGGSPSKADPRWRRLQPLYNDGYVELFRETFEFISDDADSSEYQRSQLGAVTWEPVEKSRLFKALPHVGRHNLPLLAKCVRTKSQLEVSSYLDRLKSEEIDRELFEKQTKNISHADIPAAIEIGRDCENQLDQASDALAALQEQYDQAIGQRDSVLPFAITQVVASQLDEKTDELVDRLAQGDEFEDESVPALKHPHEIFHLRMLVELSEKLFMHGSRQNPENHWRYFAEDGEVPAITQEVIADFHGLVVSLLRRLVQTTIFLAQSRLKATNTKYYSPSKKVSREDVSSALKILNVPGDLWKYWTKLPRRAGFKVVSGSKKKGDSVKVGLSHDDVEAALSVRRSSGRRRSLSVASATSSDLGSGSATSGSDEESSQDIDIEQDVEVELSDGSEDEMQEDRGLFEEDLSQEGAGPPRLPPNKRKRLIEEELDQCLEDMDQLARQEEETLISSLLGIDELRTIKHEPVELGRRPKVLRKSVDDVKIWTPSARRAEWESFPKPQTETTTIQETDDSRVKDGLHVPGITRQAG